MNPTTTEPTPLPTPRTDEARVIFNEYCDAPVAAHEMAQLERENAALCSRLLEADRQLKTAYVDAKETAVLSAALARSEERVKELEERVEMECALKNAFKERADGRAADQRAVASKAGSELEATQKELVRMKTERDEWRTKHWKAHDDAHRMFLQKEEAEATIAALTDKLARSERELAEAKELLQKSYEDQTELEERLEVSTERLAARAVSAEADLAKATAALATAREQLAERSEELLHTQNHAKYWLVRGDKAEIALREQASALAAATARCGELEGQLTTTQRQLAAAMERVEAVASKWDRKAQEHFTSASRMRDRSNYEQIESVGLTYEVCATELRAAARPDAGKETK